MILIVSGFTEVLSNSKLVLEGKEVKSSLSQQEYSTQKKFQQTIIWEGRPQDLYIEEDHAIFLLEHNVSFKFLVGNRPLCLLT